MSKVVIPPTNPITKARKIEIYLETDDSIICLKGENPYDLEMECFPFLTEDIWGGKSGSVLMTIPREFMNRLSFKTVESIKLEQVPFVPEKK